MGNERYRFECRDVANCDVIIYSEFRESIFEAVKSHMKDVHGLNLSDEDVVPYIEEL